LPARVLNGFSIGGFSAVSPILIAELAPAQIRAQMVTRNTLFIVSGQMAAFIVGALLGSLWPEQMNIWRWMNGLG
jgi:MFS family permease